LPDDRKTETGAGHRPRGRRPIEAVEDERDVFVGDAGTVVAHDDLTVPHDNLDLAAGRAPLGRVVEQVRNCALDRRRNSTHERLSERSLELDTRAVAPSAFDRIGSDEVEAHILCVGRLLVAARELDELRDER